MTVQMKKHKLQFHWIFPLCERHNGSVGCCDELPLEASQSFFLIANQKGVGQVENVLMLRLG
jgi:hypothetical protein